jgi:hypothetical protein
MAIKRGLPHPAADQTPPTLNVNLLLTESTKLEASSAAGAVFEVRATASDNVGVSSTPECKTAAGATVVLGANTTFPLGDTMVACSVKDDAGLETKQDYTVTVGEGLAVYAVVAVGVLDGEGGMHAICCLGVQLRSPRPNSSKSRAVALLLATACLPHRASWTQQH